MEPTYRTDALAYRLFRWALCFAALAFIIPLAWAAVSFTLWKLGLPSGG